MTAAQPNLNKLILPNTNTESLTLQEQEVLGEGWDETAAHSTGIPGRGFHLGLVNFLGFFGVCAPLLEMFVVYIGCLKHGSKGEQGPRREERGWVHP